MELGLFAHASGDSFPTNPRFQPAMIAQGCYLTSNPGKGVIESGGGGPLIDSGTVVITQRLIEVTQMDPPSFRHASRF
jgi:hypothetical protein